MTRLIQSFLLLFSAFVFNGLAKDGLPDPLLIGLISTESSTQLRKDWQPILDDLSSETGVKVTAFFAGDYAGVVEAMRFGKVHVAWFGNKAALEAVDRAGGEVFARCLPTGGTKGYYSILLTRKGRGLDRLDDVWSKGKELVYGGGDPNSTSATLVPAVYLFGANNIDPRKHFRAIRASTHEANLLALAAGHLDVAANNSDDFAKFTARFPERAAGMQVLWTSPLIPSDPLVVKGDLPAAAKERIQQFFTHYASGPDAPRRSKLLEALQITGFEASDNRSLDTIRRIELSRRRIQVEADATLDAGTRTTRLMEIEAALKSLQPAAP